MEVKPHTLIKHRILDVYFLICRQVAKKRKLNYADLFCGDGEIECEKTEKKQKCPFITELLEYARKGEISLKAFLNELDSSLFDKLKENVKAYGKFIDSITNEDANIVYANILQKIPKDEWSIFFLDPSNHSDLNWSTIENISKHEVYDKYNKCMRKPELIINLMTYTMQRTIPYDPDAITKALGTDIWKEKVKNKGDERINEIFREIFVQQLERLGYSTISFSIKQTPPNSNVIYHLIFASNIPRAIEIISHKFQPYIEKIKEEWAKENMKLVIMTKIKNSGGRLLTEFINPKPKL